MLRSPPSIAMRSVAVSVAWCVAWALMALGASARAQSSADGVYGRLSGDLVLSVEGHGGVMHTAGGTEGALGAALRARSLDMTGVALGYDRALGAARYDALWAAVDLRPAFFARWASDLERGPRWVDLLLDSLGIELGAVWVRPGADGLRGFGMVLGGGVEIPLVWRGGDGATLRLGARYFAVRPWDQRGTGRDDSAVEITAGLVLRQTVTGGLVRAR